MSHECPHCNERTITEWSKLISSRRNPATCSNCGKNSYIELVPSTIWIAVITTIAGLFLWPILEFGVVVLVISMFAFYAIGLHFMAKIIPLVSLGGGDVQEDH